MNTYNKKNWYKKIFIVFVLFLINVPISNADTTIFRYNVTSPIIKTVGDFKTQTECENDRTSYVQQNMGYETEMCKPVTIAGEPVIGVEAQKEGIGNVSSDYTPLAPIPGFTDETVNTNNIGQYFNIIFKFAIGLAGALAVVMIIIGGIQYMGDESIFGKTEAKKKIFSAILGLLIALGSWAILNTIDPNLLGTKGLKVKQVNFEIINLPDAGDSSTDPDFKTGSGSYSVGAVSPSVANAVTKLKQGWEIDAFRVYPSNNRMVISLKKGSEIDNTNIITISPGKNGYSEIGKGVIKDGKTPKGEWKILSIRKSKDNQPVYNGDGANMGATFWLLSPTNNGERGIGMHGNKNGTLGVTSGCIRLTNADLLALLPYVKTGISVNIKD